MLALPDSVRVSCLAEEDLPRCPRNRWPAWCKVLLLRAASQMRCWQPGSSIREAIRRPGGQRGRRLARRGGGGSGPGAGSVAGMRAADARSGLPASMLIGVSATMVYGFAAATRHSEPTSLVFQVPRGGLTVRVRQRVNVRVPELIDNASDTRIELEGNRLPVTHSKDVIHVLSSAGPGQ
jgi:hypothetical protein